MSDGGNNIYKYMTSDRKLNGENSKSEMRDMISYFEKSTGVFNGDGFIPQQELKAIQERAKANKNLWHGFISLNEEMSCKIDTSEKCMRLIKRTFGEFFRDMGLDPKNVDLICSLHKDKPHHLHIRTSTFGLQKKSRIASTGKGSSNTGTRGRSPNPSLTVCTFGSTVTSADTRNGST